MLLPGVAVILWSLADLVAARHARLHGGFFSAIVDHIQPIIWTLLAVLVPLLVALKPKPKRWGAVMAMFTGPVLTPILFGAGGWRLWQIGSIALLVLWIEGADQVRARRRVDEEEPVAEVAATGWEDAPGSETAVSPPLPLHAISGASFQRRSSS